MGSLNHRSSRSKDEPPTEASAFSRTQGRERPASGFTWRSQASPESSGMGTAPGARRCGGRDSGAPEQRGLGRERRQRVLISRLLSGDHPSAPPGTLGQTARRPPGSLQIALAWGEGAQRHRLLGEGRAGHAGGLGTWAPAVGQLQGQGRGCFRGSSFQSPGSGVLRSRKGELEPGSGGGGEPRTPWAPGRGLGSLGDLSHSLRVKRKTGKSWLGRGEIEIGKAVD